MSFAHIPEAEKPPALLALEQYPLLLEPVAPGLQQQLHLIQAHTRQFVGQRAILTEIDSLIRRHNRGCIVLEGEPGCGITTVLAHLAATRPVAFWFAEADAHMGAAALAAQLIALYALNVPLLPPAIQSDATILEKLLAAAAEQTTPDAPLVLLIDAPVPTSQPASALPPVFPVDLPANTVLIYGSLPEASLPCKPDARVVLPQRGSGMLRDQSQMLLRMGCTTDKLVPIVTASRGNLYYLHLAHGIVEAGLIDPHSLQPGLDSLYAVWWQSLDATGQRLAALLAAAAEPMPLILCARLLGSDPRPLLQAWNQLGLLRASTSAARLGHWSLVEYLVQHVPDQVAQAHANIATLAYQSFLHDGSIEAIEAGAGEADQQPAAPSRYLQTSLPYLERQFARHAALGTPHTRNQLLAQVARRGWMLAQERRTGQMTAAARDLAWELYEAGHLRTAAPDAQATVRLVKAAALTGTLVTRSRTLSPEAAVEALKQAIEHEGREPGLRQVRALVDQVPDGHAKAQILRQMGEACYGLKMKSAAMRLLSQALDIEELKLPVSWDEQRDTLHGELAQAALERAEVELALQMVNRIGHVERRGMVQTRIVRWLLHQGDPTRARGIASSIEHESLEAWAQSEVAVSLARTGKLAEAEALLARIYSETARAWAEIELACDLAASDEDAARARIDRLDSPNQRDRGLAQLAQALASADKDGDALDAAVLIGDVAVRVSALIDLRLRLEGLVAMLALEQATAVIDKLPRDVRVPLVSMLAAAYASLGKQDEARTVANQLAEGEERDRGLSRVAVAMGQRGDMADGLAVARSLADDDERDWTLDELAHALGKLGDWQAARALTSEISTEAQQAQTLANLAIAQARAGQPVEALHLARAITSHADYVRCVTLLAPELVQADQTDMALAVVRMPAAETNDHAYGLNPAQTSRYLAAVAAALAEQQKLEQAASLTHEMARPLDRARTHLAIAQACIDHQHTPADIFAALSAALGVAFYGRDEVFRILPHTAPVLIALGGSALLNDISATIEEIDHW